MSTPCSFTVGILNLKQTNIMWIILQSSEDDNQDIQNYKCIKAMTEKPILKVIGLNVGTDSPTLPHVTVHYTTMINLHEVASTLFYTPDIM